MLTPSASNRSALPQRLDTDRLPCLATRTPQAASTSAATVETLNVCAPVAARAAGVEHRRDSATSCVARARIVRAKPTTSAGRSPFMASAMSSAAICDGCARPSMISSIAAAASSAVRSCRRCSFSSSAGNITAPGNCAAACLPSPVSTDSGWNWTPWIGNCRCRTPMSVPSSVRAETSSASGSGSRDDQRVIAPGRRTAATRPRRRRGRRAGSSRPCRASAAARGRPRRRTRCRCPGGRGRRRAAACAGRSGG